MTNSHFYHQTMKYHLTKIVVSFKKNRPKRGKTSGKKK